MNPLQIKSSPRPEYLSELNHQISALNPRLRIQLLQGLNALAEGLAEVETFDPAEDLGDGQATQQRAVVIGTELRVVLGRVTVKQAGRIQPTGISVGPGGLKLLALRTYATLGRGSSCQEPEGVWTERLREGTGLHVEEDSAWTWQHPDGRCYVATGVRGVIVAQGPQHAGQWLTREAGQSLLEALRAFKQS